MDGVSPYQPFDEIAGSVRIIPLIEVLSKELETRPQEAVKRGTGIDRARLSRLLLEPRHAPVFIYFGHAGPREFRSVTLNVDRDAVGSRLMKEVDKFGETKVEDIVGAHHQKIGVNRTLRKSETDVRHGAEATLVTGRPIVQDLDTCPIRQPSKPPPLKRGPWTPGVPARSRYNVMRCGSPHS